MDASPDQMVLEQTSSDSQASNTSAEPTTPASSKPKHAHKRLSEGDRGFILGMKRAGATHGQIAAATGFGKTTVREVIKRGTYSGTGVGIGRPKKTTDEHVQAIMQLRRERPGITYKEMRDAMGLDVSEATISRLLRAGPSGVSVNSSPAGK